MKFLQFLNFITKQLLDSYKPKSKNEFEIILLKDEKEIENSEECQFKNDEESISPLVIDNNDGQFENDEEWISPLAIDNGQFENDEEWISPLAIDNGQFENAEELISPLVIYNNDNQLMKYW